MLRSAIRSPARRLTPWLAGLLLLGAWPALGQTASAQAVAAPQAVLSRPAKLREDICDPYIDPTCDPSTYPDEEVYDPQENLWEDLGLTDDPTLAFATFYDAPPETWIESGFYVLTGLTEVAPISIVGGEYSIDFGDYTSAPGVVVDGSIVIVRLLTPTAFGATATAQFSIGGQSYSFATVNISETDLASLLDLFGGETPDISLVNGEAVLTADTAAPLLLEDSAPDNAILRLNKDVDADFDNAANTSDLKLSAKDASQFQTVAYDDAAGQRSTLLRLLKGDAEVQLRGDNGLVPLNDPSGAAKTGKFSALGGSKNTVFQIKTNTTTQQGSNADDSGYYEAWIKGGQAEVRELSSTGASRNRFAASAAPLPVYAGETAAFDGKGTLRQVRIGSLNGDQALPGDPLALPLLDQDTKVPNLAGALARFGGASLLQIVNEALDARLGGKGTVAYSASSGVLTYTLGQEVYRFLPLGAPTVDLPPTAATRQASRKSTRRYGNRFAASNPGSIASGTFSLVARGVQLTLAGTLGYFTDMDQALKAIDPSARLKLRASGLLHLSLGGREFVVRPASLVGGADSAPGTPAFLVDSQGGLSFRDSRGGRQTLYPAFADLAALERTIKSLAPDAVLTDPGNGGVTLKLGDNQLRLKPALSLSPVPAAQSKALFWQEGGSLFIRYPDNTAQGFSF